MQMPVSDAAPGSHPSGPPAVEPAPQLAVFAQQGDVPTTGSPPVAAAALALAADSVMKHGSHAPLSAAAEVPAHTLTAGPGT